MLSCFSLSIESLPLCKNWGCAENYDARNSGHVRCPDTQPFWSGQLHLTSVSMKSSVPPESHIAAMDNNDFTKCKEMFHALTLGGRVKACPMSLFEIILWWCHLGGPP